MTYSTNIHTFHPAPPLGWTRSHSSKLVQCRTSRCGRLSGRWTKVWCTKNMVALEAHWLGWW